MTPPPSRPPALTTPFRPSLLSFSPSPRSLHSLSPSPRSPSPATPPSLLPTSPATPTTTKPTTTPPPPPPLPWLWQCHLCHRTYPLAATRRCLDDGHYFCTGARATRTVRGEPIRRARRAKACPSEFDYHGWKAWGAWRRAERGEGVGGCEGRCDYPSACRWGATGEGEGDVEMAEGVVEVAKGDVEMGEGDVKMAEAGAEARAVATSFEEMLGVQGGQEESEVESSARERREVHDFWASLLQGMKGAGKAEEGRPRLGSGVRSLVWL